MVVNSCGSNGLKFSRGVYKITSLATEPYLASVCTALRSPIPIESRRTPPSPLPTTSRRHSTPHRAAPLLHCLHSPPCHAAAPHCVTPALHSPPRRAIVSTPQHARFIMADSGGSINDDLQHCGFVPDDNDGDGGPYTQPTTTSAPVPPPPTGGSPTPSTASTDTSAGGAAKR
jgi:hypothetical protein